MRLLRAEVENFGSYKHLEFSYSDLGLSLIHGPTGSGKSTVMDIAPWVLFGVTAKNGAADDVRNWSDLKGSTKGSIYVDVSGVVVSVHRVRGRSNDLYLNDGGSIVRGKDSRDTQKIISERLGCDETLYLLGSYFCDSSPSARFFESAARDRRSLLERCTDLRLPATLGERCTQARKDCKRSVQDLSGRMSSLLGAAEQTRKLYERAEKQEKEWAGQQAELLRDLAAKRDSFTERNRENVASAVSRINRIKAEIGEASTPSSKACKACGSENKEYREAVRQNDRKVQELGAAASDLHRLESVNNPYPEQLERELDRTNPHTASLIQLKSDLSTHESGVSELNKQLDTSNKRLGLLDTLYDLSLRLRGVLLTTAVEEVHNETNRILETYFAGEFRVAFTVESDDLEVSITKSGYSCSFRQLSKGQRQILRLSFAVALMQRVSAQAGVQFENLFLDEPADGGDTEVKANAFRLFQEMSIGRDSVTVIDHSPEFQNLFERKIEVSMKGDYSEVRDA